MELDYALLAERASRLDDGRLVIYGGDIDGVQANKMPVRFQTTLVAKMLVEEGEATDGHVLEIACTSPAGNRVIVVRDEGLDAPAVSDGMRPAAGLIAVLNMIFKEPGVYRIHLLIDGKELKTIPLRVDSEIGQAEAKYVENAIAHND